VNRNARDWGGLGSSKPGDPAAATAPRAQANSPVPRISLGIADAAIAMGVSETTIKGWLRERRIGCYREGRRRLIPVSELERYSRERTAEEAARRDSLIVTRPRRMGASA
jgi:excisionase family DNA binding protein